MTATDIELRVHAAVAGVDDPEYPGISIVDLGLLESIAIDRGSVTIGLVPTFSGCPALAVIAAEVEAAVAEVDGVEHVAAHWLARPAWSTDRISHDARAALAHDFTVAVSIGARPVQCPRCGTETREQSLFGPSRCRSVHRCPSCHEAVEVMRS